MKYSFPKFTINLCAASFVIGLTTFLTSPVAFADPESETEVDSRSVHLFNMPTEQTVGAYQLLIRGDGSLVKEPGVLSFAGLIAVGIGELGQLEYRHTGAISLGNRSAPLPTAGMQLLVPIPERWKVPQIGVAFRLGVLHEDAIDEVEIAERVSDLYFVSSFRLPGAMSPVQLHGGVRVSSAEAIVKSQGMDDDPLKTRETLLLPSIGWSAQMNPDARIIGEAEWVPRFVAGGENQPVRIETGILGRLGVDWRMNSYFALNASIGYTLESPSTLARDGINLMNWDIRLGGEFFLPWRKPLCRNLSFICPKGE